jgi:hypothetical protein
VPSGQGEDFLQAVIRGLSRQEQETLETELRYLVNAALVAEGAEPGDLGAVKGVSERARDYLLLGLELLSGGDVSLAPEVVREVTSRQVFQTGFSLTLQLKFRADRMMRGPLAKLAGVEWVLGPEAKVLAALRRKRPLKALKVEGAEPVPFRSRRELAEAGAALDRAEQQLKLFEALLGPSAEDARERLAQLKDEAHPLSPERVLALAIAQAVLGHGFRPAALKPGEQAEVEHRLFQGDGLRPEAVQALHRELEQALPNACIHEAKRVAELLVPRLGEELE